MASQTLYPPVLDSYLPSFVVGKTGDNKCVIPFSLSKFSGINGFKSVHVAITKQSTGMSCVNTKSDDGMKDGWYMGDGSSKRNGATGIILDVKPLTNRTSDGRFQIVLTDKDIQPVKESVYYRMDDEGNVLKTVDTSSGWIPGWIYKIQIRLSEIDYASSYYEDDTSVMKSNAPTPTAWLINNSSKFSEWSTICVVKATGEPHVVIPELKMEYPYFRNDNKDIEKYINALDLHGEYGNFDPTEPLKSYRVRIYRGPQAFTESGWDFEDNMMIEDSGVRYDATLDKTNLNNEEILKTVESPVALTDLCWMSHFNYLATTEFQDQDTYTVRFNFETINGLTFELVDVVTLREMILEKSNSFKLKPANFNGKPTNSSFGDLEVFEEECEEGRLGLILEDKDPSAPLSSCNICIRKSDQDSNFKEWRDFKIVTLYADDYVENVGTIYDYNIESGKYYMYGAQLIDRDGNRTKMKLMNPQNPIMRDFNYSFLLGGDGRQLKLMFDNGMDSFQITRADTKVDTIGSRFPYITRNSEIEYKQFPITGLISFWSDENKLFFSEEEAFKGKYYDNEYGTNFEVKEINDTYIAEMNIVQYDYNREKRFRDKALEWLNDGQVKLFKSPTEGNILVRLMNVTFTPNRTLDRMIYSFSCTAYEIAAPTYDNLFKYGFIKPGDYAEDFAIYKTKIGQVSGEFAITDNIFNAIYEKYDSAGQRQAGKKFTIQDVYAISITIHDKPLRVRNSIGEIVLGHNFKISDVNNVITIYHPKDTYVIDERLHYSFKGGARPELYLLGDEPLGTVDGAASLAIVERKIAEITTKIERFEWLSNADSKYYPSGNNTDPPMMDSTNPRRYVNFRTLDKKRRKNMTDEEYQLWKTWRAEYRALVAEFMTLRRAKNQLAELEQEKSYILNGRVQKINATIDFLYKLKEEDYLGRRIESQIISRQLGQIYQRMEPSFLNVTTGKVYEQSGKLTGGILNELKSRYYINETDSNGKDLFVNLSSIEHIEIEADPHAVFGICDDDDLLFEEHDMNETGVLSLYNLGGFKNIKFLGYRNPDGTLRTTYEETDRNGNKKLAPVWTDALFNYIVIVKSGVYKEDI